MSQLSGRLEIYTLAANEWGTVCYDGFIPESANTACRQLGYAWAERFGEAVSLG